MLCSLSENEQNPSIQMSTKLGHRYLHPCKPCAFPYHLEHCLENSSNVRGEARFFSSLLSTNIVIQSFSELMYKSFYTMVWQCTGCRLASFRLMILKFEF